MKKFRCHDCKLVFTLRSDAVEHVRLMHKRLPRDEGAGKAIADLMDLVDRMVPNGAKQ